MKNNNTIEVDKKIGFVETPIEIANLMVHLITQSTDALVLDTGFGKGVFLEVLKKNQYKNVYGIEISKEFYENVHIRYGNMVKLINDDFLSYKFSHKFDIIIGNPPYVHFNSLPVNLSKSVKYYNKTSESDIYYSFIMKAIELLNENGELIYIVPYHFFCNTHAKTLRQFLLNNGVFEIIIDLDESRIFKNENPEIIIFRYRKIRYSTEQKIEILKIKKPSKSKDIYQNCIKSLQTKKSNNLFEHYYIPQYSLSQRIWNTIYNDKLNFPSIKLKNIAKVGVGLVSGFDQAFRIDHINIDNITLKEKSIIKKFIKAQNCKRYYVESYSLYYIIEKHNLSDKDIEYLYPNFSKILKKYYPNLNNRYLPSNTKWYNWQALRNYKFLLENMNKQKIFVPVMDRSKFFRFSLSSGGFLPSADVLFIQPFKDEDIFWLLGYLNSEFFKNYYLSNGARRGGRIAFNQSIVENIEIPDFSKKVKKQISELAREIYQSAKSNQDISQKEEILNQIINNVMTSGNSENFENKNKYQTSIQLSIFNE